MDKRATITILVGLGFFVVGIIGFVIGGFGVAGLEESPGEEGGCAQHRRDKPEHNRAQCPHSDVIGHKHEQQGPSPLDKSSFDSLQKAFGFGVEAPCAVQWKVADTRESRRGVAVMSGRSANQHRCCAHCNTRARALT